MNRNKILSNKRFLNEILTNEELLNKILTNKISIDKILSGNKVLDKILAGDRTFSKILSNTNIHDKLLRNDDFRKKFISNSADLNKIKTNDKSPSNLKQPMPKEKAMSLGYSLPTYLVGFPRSGTNFLQSVLEGSSGLLCKSIYSYPKVSSKDILSLKSHTPSYEFLLDEISRYVPGFEVPEKAILIVRDPRDVFISFYEFVRSTKDVSIAQSDFLNKVSYFFATFKDHHNINSRKSEIAPLSIFHAYKKHIDSWFVHREQSLDCHVVKYENLILSPEAEFQHIFDFLNLDCVLEKDRLELKVSQYSSTKRKRGVSGGWRHCKDQYGELIALVNIAFKKEIQILGYSID